MFVESMRVRVRIPGITGVLSGIVKEVLNGDILRVQVTYTGDARVARRTAVIEVKSDMLEV